MSTEWVINDAIFAKIKDLPYSPGEAIKQFVDNVIYKHPNWQILLCNLSDIYVLQALFGSEQYVRKDEKGWKEIMCIAEELQKTLPKTIAELQKTLPKYINNQSIPTDILDIIAEFIPNYESYNMLKKNRSYIVGYMLVTEKDENCHYIELFDTIIRKNNIGLVMIEKYKEMHNYPTLVPQIIVPDEAKYWAKVLNLPYPYQKNAIDEFIHDNDLDWNDLAWEHLYKLCDNDDEPIEKNSEKYKIISRFFTHAY